MRQFFKIFIFSLLPFSLHAQSKIDSVLNILYSKSDYQLTTHTWNFNKVLRDTTSSESSSQILHFRTDSVIYEDGRKGFALATSEFSYQVIYKDKLIKWVKFPSANVLDMHFKFVNKFFSSSYSINDTLVIILHPNNLEIKKIEIKIGDILYIAVYHEDKDNSSIFDFNFKPIRRNIPKHIVNKMEKLIFHNDKITRLGEFSKYRLVNIDDMDFHNID